MSIVFFRLVNVVVEFDISCSSIFGAHRWRFDSGILRSKRLNLTHWRELILVQCTHPLALFSLVVVEDDEVDDDDEEEDEEEEEGRATARTTIGARAETPLLLPLLLRRCCSFCWAGRSCEPARRAMEDCIVAFVSFVFCKKEKRRKKKKVKKCGFSLLARCLTRCDVVVVVGRLCSTIKKKKHGLPTTLPVSTLASRPGPGVVARAS